MGYKICPYCGAHLDPDERCDCRDEVATSQEKEVYEVKKITEGKEVRELNLIANKGGSGSVGFKLSIPKPWAAALGVDLNNKTVVASFDGDKIIISGIKK